MARRRIGRGIFALTVAVTALPVPVPLVPVATGVVLVLRAVIAGGIGRIASVIVTIIRRGLGVGRRVGTASAGGCVAVVPGIVVPGLRQAVISLLDAQVVPGLGGSVNPASRMSAWVTSCDAICQRSGSRSPRRVWCFSAHAITTRAIAVSIRWASVSAIQRGE